MTATVDDWRTDLDALRTWRNNSQGRSSIKLSDGTEVSWDLAQINMLIERYERKINALTRTPITLSACN